MHNFRRLGSVLSYLSIRKLLSLEDSEFDVGLKLLQ